MSNLIKKSKKTKATDEKKSVTNPKKQLPIASKDEIDMMTTAEKLQYYLERVDNETLARLPQDKILEIRKKQNPYGANVDGPEKFMNFSITQITHEYWKKFMITSLIGYMNRMCDEWKVPANVPVKSVYEYIDDPKCLDTPEDILKKENKSAMYDWEFNREWMKKRMIVKEFLEEMFQFNPDEHVRSAYRPNYKDSTRKPLDTMAARLAVRHAAKTDNDLKQEYKERLTSQGVTLRRVKKAIKGRDGTIKYVIKEVPVDMPPVEAPAPTDPQPLDPEHPVDKNVVSTVTNMIPPHDIFGRFTLYYKENYEQLRDAVNHLYCEKPDFELAINPYSWHDNQDDAERWKKQHAEQVIAEVFTVQANKWNFFDSFKKQRESVNFYNKNTIILEEMVKQLERDERLGQDLMRKKVEKEKAKNVIEAGPDDPAVKKWIESNNELSKLGAKHIGGMADEDMPEDSVQVDVWKLAKGGLELAKDKFYSAAEAPTFVQDAQNAAAVGAAPSIEPRGDNL